MYFIRNKERDVGETGYDLKLVNKILAVDKDHYSLSLLVCILSEETNDDKIIAYHEA